MLSSDCLQLGTSRKWRCVWLPFAKSSKSDIRETCHPDKQGFQKNGDGSSTNSDNRPGQEGAPNYKSSAIGSTFVLCVMASCFE